MPIIINIRNYGKTLPPNTIILDRRSEWGNPYRITQVLSREEVIAKHRKWFFYGSDASNLRGKIEELDKYDYWACWCTEEACHLDNLKDFLDIIKGR
ncbi:hypothetical protein LCGC14_0422420 [marine sediment metagenome]|uniref:DUF4326 domain-containing protein n=1 Tax=marine sediment metagenome TaxID=412755 RepID=A0A0F9T8Q6_9ZZZZ